MLQIFLEIEINGVESKESWNFEQGTCDFQAYKFAYCKLQFIGVNISLIKQIIKLRASHPRAYILFENMLKDSSMCWKLYFYNSTETQNVPQVVDAIMAVFSTRIKKIKFLCVSIEAQNQSRKFRRTEKKKKMSQNLPVKHFRVFLH